MSLGVHRNVTPGQAVSTSSHRPASTTRAERGTPAGVSSSQSHLSVGGMGERHARVVSSLSGLVLSPEVQIGRTGKQCDQISQAPWLSKIVPRTRLQAGVGFNNTSPAAAKASPSDRRSSCATIVPSLRCSVRRIRALRFTVRRSPFFCLRESGGRLDCTTRAKHPHEPGLQQ